MEIWKKIKGYKFYEVSNLGKVRSLDRFVSCRGGVRKVNGRILKQKKTTTGYYHVQMGNGSKFELVHRLVAKAFIPNSKNKPQVNHKDGKKLHNRVENLEWCTRSENQLHAYKTGLQIPSKHKRASGENCGASKLTWVEVNLIRKLYKRGDGIVLARSFGVSQPTILNIINNKTWVI